MAKKTDVMDYLEIPLLGNAVQDWTISLAIFATSLVIAHYAHRAIRQVVFKWALKAQTQLGEERVTRACALITWAIPIVGFVLASNRLVLDKALSVWIPIGVLISSQIVSLLILMNLLPPLMGMMSSRYIDRVAEERLDYHQEHKQSVAATEKETQQCLGILLILVPLLTVLST
ncbi:MAG: hypothetical protein SWE60_20435, partial [Thermodesulfobacteriota bacterium]|nr:hypothetical protein [Thermodesulfobacteriota bacterium]